MDAIIGGLLDGLSEALSGLICTFLLPIVEEALDQIRCMTFQSRAKKVGLICTFLLPIVEEALDQIRCMTFQSRAKKVKLC